MERACIVLPTYNEAANVGVLLPRIFEHVAVSRTYDVHVLVVDDDSPDGTQDVVARLMHGQPRLHVLRGRKAGLGVAYLRGFDHALRSLGASVLLQMDADLQHPPELLPVFLELAARGFDVVIGSRFAPGGFTPDFAWRRRVMSRFGNLLVRWLGGLPPLHDCTSGFRCIRAELLRRCDLSLLLTRGYAFQTSLLSELIRRGARPIEVPMVFGARAYGASKLTLRDELEFLANLVLLRARRVAAFGHGAGRLVAELLRAADAPPRLSVVPRPPLPAPRGAEVR